MTTYPKVSHTFIRKEILEIEARGHVVRRLAVGPLAPELVDSEDVREAKKTLQSFNRPLALLVSVLILFSTRPIVFVRSIIQCINSGLGSEIGVHKQLYCFFQAAYLLRAVKRDGVDHVHAHFGSSAATVARWLWRLGKVPFSFTVHAHDTLDRPRSLEIQGKVHDAQFVIGISSYTVSQLYRWTQVQDWKKIHLVRCAVGSDFLTETEPVSETSLSFVCVARLDPEKGHFILLEALEQLVAAGLHGKLVLVGDGRSRRDLEEYIAGTDISNLVELTGNLDANGVRRRIREARALVLPSFMEGLPIAIMEAFAQRRPVISTYIAGIPELVVPNVNGWLVPAGNSLDLSMAMREALEAPVESLRRMGNAGRMMIEQNHSLEKEVGRLESLFVGQDDISTDNSKPIRNSWNDSTG